MTMKSAVSSFLIVLILSGCENKAEPVKDETKVAPQQQYEQGKIETHSTE
jgi:uncharacterized lipoprotein NlpE involved in copper resistance